MFKAIKELLFGKPAEQPAPVEPAVLTEISTPISATAAPAELLVPTVAEVSAVNKTKAVKSVSRATNKQSPNKKVSSTKPPRKPTVK